MGDDFSVDSETLLTIDLVNFKIKSAQFFRSVYKGKMCVHIFIGVDVRSICTYTVY
jgi:hypothetical protein